jgi:pyridoxamine 5'-phosphate oxidase
MVSPVEPEEIPAPDPIVRFTDAMERARAVEAFDATRVALATATPDGRPSVRFVLCKDADHRGFVFFTCYESRKGRELDANPRAALCFHWWSTNEQVRVEGRVERVSPGESDAYFATRPRGSQLGAWASRQSEPVATRDALDRAFDEVAARFPGEVPRPPQWGGYRVVADRIEFWRHRDDRMHDRWLYVREPDGTWSVSRLSP